MTNFYEGEIVLTQYKLKKTEGMSEPTSAPLSSSGPEFATICKKMSRVMTSPQPTIASTKTRSSSMDELRATGEELSSNVLSCECSSDEHWYSADSDTEPDSLTVIQEPRQLSNGQSTFSLGNMISCGIGNGSGVENGSRLDIGSVIPDAPKAPKFRRGTGFKDKWRESWSSSTKPLSKQNLDDDNKLLRWFSLRKNQANIESPGVKQSTLPLLSEEDLKRISYIEDEEGYWPRRTVQPPNLPPPPADLTSEQITRRHIVAAIVHSENSYVAALQRLVNEYKKPLERSHPAILSHSKISSIFHRVPEILQCHSLFRIALAECVRRWDVDGKIGDVFVASFSKSLVLDVYSEFINNFGLAMDTAKIEARRKCAFADFLKVKQMTAHDRLSLFGLMVKPVQRFPQFILLLQDLLKHTPKDHHDRMSLQLALTQLESLAAMLNERKRESEQYQAFRETIKSIGGGKFVLLRSIADDPNRILLRQDVVTQLEFDNSGAAVAKSKSRKLLLLNDMLICVALSQPSSTAEQQQGSINALGNPTCNDVNSNGTNGSNKAKKSVFKWSYPVREVDVDDISISPTMSRFVHSGSGTSNTNVNKSQRSSTPGNSAGGLRTLPEEVTTTASISPLEEMQSLMHDYEVLSRILMLASSLKSQYDGLTELSVKELMLEIQHQIRCRDEEISYFDSSCLTLLVGTGNSRDKLIFQMQSPAARNEWIEELRLAQLALDPNNSPSWDIPSESPYPHHKLPLFVRSLTLTKSTNAATVKCGCFFTHTFVSPTGRSKILDYLWVSSTDGMSSHITAFRSQQYALKEVQCFDLVEEKINDLLFVSGHVWLATESRKIMVMDPADPEKGSISHYILSDGVLKLTHFEGCIYAGLADGTVAVFLDHNPQNLKPEYLIKVGTEKVRSLFGSRDHVYAACGNAVVCIDVKTHIIERTVVLNHHNGHIAHMACSGVGLWITTEESGTVCLYHLESLQHLQDVSIAPSVFRTVRDSFRRQKGCYVTCLTAHKGWLWIGTNLGVILTIPLPRLEGVPIITTGKANVSLHGYYGPVSFLMPLTKPSPQLTTVRHKQISIIPPALSDESASGKRILNKGHKTEGTTKQNEDELSKYSSLSLDETIVSELKDNCNSSSSSTQAVLAKGSESSNQSGTSLTRTLSDGSGGGDSPVSKTLVVHRKKNSKDNVFMRNCKTLPRGGPLSSNLRFSIDTDVYGLYGNLINVRGLEDEGRFVDPLYDALRRSDPELVALDAKISTLDRRLKMRMSRPRSLDLSNWSIDSKISASSDDSVGVQSSSATVDTTNLQDIHSPSPVSPESTPNQNVPNGASNTNNKKTIGRAKRKNKPQTERTVVVIVGGQGYLNRRNQSDLFASKMSSDQSDSSHCAHLTLMLLAIFEFPDFTV
ncbi:unnamed protein product [Allacma fusca]|uniref:DH domain-containing protein n=1 Tax=Allacma fusca TaxID=39272 RepID=A0A8J2KP27_9HEXA|nr:unnamed protein product [Allacma fusca]